MCCGTSPFTMAWYSIKSSSDVFNNSRRSINCRFMVSKDSTVRWTESNEGVLLRSKINKFEERNPPVVTTLHNIGRFLKKRSGSIKEFVKNFLRNISVFRKLFTFRLVRMTIPRSIFLIPRSFFWFCKEISSFAKDFYSFLSFG